MNTYLIRGKYWCAFDLGDRQGGKAVGIISRVDAKTGITEVLSTLDEHGVGLVAELVNKLEAVKKPMVVLPTFDGYVPHIAKELQSAFRIACNNAGIGIVVGNRNGGE